MVCAVCLWAAELLGLVRVLGEGSCPALLRLDLLLAASSRHPHHLQQQQQAEAGQEQQMLSLPERVSVWSKALSAMPALRELVRPPPP